jgi:intracellular septation protein
MANGGGKGIVRLVVDYGGLVVFLAAFLVTHDVVKATWGLVAGSAAALAVGLAVERRLAPLPLFAGVMALIFGALTLKFHDPRFIKIKPTVTNLIFAGVMLGGVAMGRNPLKALFSGALNLSPAAWRRLTIRYGIFFLAMAALNEAVWRTQPDSIWVLFKFPGMEILILLFAASQVPMMMKDMKAMETAAEMEI